MLFKKFNSVLPLLKCLLNFVTQFPTFAAMTKSVVLKKGKDIFVRRHHPWIFSGAIAKTIGNPAEGDRVSVIDYKGDQLGAGHFQEGSIRVRIIHHGTTDPAPSFWLDRLKNAYNSRQMIGLMSKQTNAYRLVHGAGDRLPGLVIDIYHNTAVVQCHSWGMYLEREAIASALRSIYGSDLQNIYMKGQSTLPQRFESEVTDGYLHGDGAVQVIKENGHNFMVDPENGQKTGFFLDQRDNRALLGLYSKGKTVLNTFCYTGGFSIYALAAGALSVDSVDVSGKAMAMVDENVGLNPDYSDRHYSHKSDVLQFLRASDKQYDIVVVDPPAYAKSVKKRHRAVQGYKRLNAEAMKKVKPGGLLFTFSCSQVVDRQLFQDTIVAAGLETNRQARVLHQLTQGPDHPVNLFHPEGAYLKGLVLQIE